MSMIILTIVFYLLLLDAVSGNLMALFGRDWYAKHFRTFSRLLPLAEGWVVYYLILVLWIGYVSYLAGAPII